MAQPDELDGTEQPFVAHLIELRDRLVRALISIGIAFGLLCAWPGPKRMYDLLALPLVTAIPNSHLIATGVISPFLVPLKITLLASFMLALPFVLYQVWAFVAPGLYSHEKRLVLPLVVSSTLLFLAGVAFCYFFVFGKVFAFIQAAAPTSVQVSPDIEAYLGFALNMFLAFGAAFEVPVAVVLLARLGIVSIDKLAEFRRYFIVVATVVAALITPPDIASMLSLLVSMVLLYEGGLFAARLFVKKTTKPEEGSTSKSSNSSK